MVLLFILEKLLYNKTLTNLEHLVFDGNIKLQPWRIDLTIIQSIQQGLY